MVLSCQGGKMDRIVTVDMSIGTLAVLISGLYIHQTGISVEAIPSSLYIELAEKLSEFLPLNIDEFIQKLIIAPKELFTEQELVDYENNAIFIKRRLGNATLIATAKI